MRERGTKPQRYPLNPASSLPAERRAQIADEVLARYIGGEQIAHIAGEYGYGHVSLYALLWREREAEFCQAQVARALARHAAALGELDAVKAALEEAKGTPDAMTEISRQRELLRLSEVRLKSGQWELEKLARRLYGIDPPTLQVVNIGNVNARIADLERELGVAVKIETSDRAEEEEATDSGD